MQWLAFLFAFVAGAFISIQAGSNTALKKALGDPMPAVVVNYLLGATSVIVYAIASKVSIRVRFTDESRLFRALPLPFAPEATTLATVSPRALVRLDGAVYSVPSRWAGLDLVVRTGATTVTVVGRDGTPIVHPRPRVGQRSIDYRHYLSELARKPQAVRQVLPDLLRDLGAPVDQLSNRGMASLLTSNPTMTGTNRTI